MTRIIIFFFVFASFTAKAQQNDLQVFGSAGNNYLIHKVVAKENWFSIGRLYNVHPKELAVYNKSNVEKGLLIDQIINVPIVAQNRVDFFAMLEQGEEKVPLYHIVKKEDALYRISVNNGTTMQVIREWNDLTNDTLRLGQKLKVGFLKVKFNESALVNNKLSPIPTYPEATVTATDVPPVISSTPTLTSTQQPATTATNVSTKADVEPNKPAVVNVKPGTDIASIEPREGQDVTKPIVEPTVASSEVPAKKNQQEKPKTEEPKVEPVITKPIELNSVGFYKNENIANLTIADEKREILSSGVFKCNAGWDDDKYFIMLNGVKPGSVVKIINPKSNKSVFALVLDDNAVMGKINNTDCSLSKATAYALGIKEELFEIGVVK